MGSIELITTLQQLLDDVAALVASKGAANSIATLNASSLVVQNPANAQVLSAASKIPISGADGKLAIGWIPDLSAYALLGGRLGSQTLEGGTAANEDITISSTHHATKGYVNIAPGAGSVKIGYSLRTLGIGQHDGAAADMGIWHNAYAVPYPTSLLRWADTHVNFGSRGIQFNFLYGIQFFADAVASTKDAVFTPTERMMIGVDGKVRIGPAKTAAGQFEVFGDPAAGTTTGDFVVDTAARTVYVGRLSTTVGDHSIFKCRNRTNTNVFSIDANTNLGYFVGNFGLGTLYPSDRLHAIDGIAISHQTQDAAYKYRFFCSVDQTWLGIGYWTSDWYPGGASTPAIKLQYDGIVRIPASLYVLTAAYKPGGGSWSDSCDLRLKTEVQDIEDGLNKIMQLRPVRWAWQNPEEHAGRPSDAGFVAQEVAQVFPSWIHETDPTGRDRDLIPDGESALSMSLPFEFDALLVAAIQEQQTQIEELKAALADRDAQIAALGERLSVLEAASGV